MEVDLNLKSSVRTKPLKFVEGKLCLIQTDLIVHSTEYKSQEYLVTLIKLTHKILNKHIWIQKYSSTKIHMVLSKQPCPRSQRVWTD